MATAIRPSIHRPTPGRVVVLVVTCVLLAGASTGCGDVSDPAGPGGGGPSRPSEAPSRSAPQFGCSYIDQFGSRVRTPGLMTAEACKMNFNGCSINDQGPLGCR
jgi:hypothetical protein